MGIIVEWIRPAVPGIEYIDDIDLDNLENCPARMRTEFWSPDEDEFSVWEVSIQVEEQIDGHTVLILRYDRDRNPEFHDLDDGYWGTNRIFVPQGKIHGHYCWTSESGDVIESPKYGWKKKKMREPRDHRRSHQQIRDDNFRPQIIALDQRCVISGETTKEMLDAAHIIPAREDGNEIRDNGIALRADIHRLYDAKMFFIHPATGKPVINPVINNELSDRLSQAYINLLKDSEGLPPETLERVQEALIEVWSVD